MCSTIQQLAMDIGSHDVDARKKLVQIIQASMEECAKAHTIHDAITKDDAVPHVIYHNVETARQHFLNGRTDIIRRMIDILEQNVLADLKNIGQANCVLLNRVDVDMVNHYTPANENHAQAQDLIRVECRVFITLLPKNDDEPLA